jgi:hypothetical protein
MSERRGGKVRNYKDTFFNGIVSHTNAGSFQTGSPHSTHTPELRCSVKCEGKMTRQVRGEVAFLSDGDVPFYYVDEGDPPFMPVDAPPFSSHQKK